MFVISTFEKCLTCDFKFLWKYFAHYPIILRTNDGKTSENCICFICGTLQSSQNFNLTLWRKVQISTNIVCIRKGKKKGKTKSVSSPTNNAPVSKYLAGGPWCSSNTELKTVSRFPECKDRAWQKFPVYLGETMRAHNSLGLSWVSGDFTQRFL